MRRKILPLLAIVYCVILCSAAKADFFSDGYFYTGATGSVSFLEDHEYIGTLETSHDNYKTGFGFGASFGYQYRQWHFEIEGLHRRNRLSSSGFDGSGSVPTDGTYENWAVMFNVLYSMPFYCQFGIYVGGGLGVAFNELDYRAIDGFPTNNRTKETFFAWQVLAGASYSVTSCIAITAGYRLFATDKHYQQTDFPEIIRVLDTPLTHSFDVGIRVAL